MLSNFLPKKKFFSNDTSKKFFFEKTIACSSPKWHFFAFFGMGVKKKFFFKVFQKVIIRIYIGSKPPTMLPMDPHTPHMYYIEHKSNLKDFEKNGFFDGGA